MSLSTSGPAPNVPNTLSINFQPTFPTFNTTEPGVAFTTTGSPPSGYNYGSPPVTEANLWLVMMQDMGGSDYIPFLAIDFGLWIRKDLECYGAIMTTTNPANLAQNLGGGGAILMGHGLTGVNDPPCIELTDAGSNSAFGTLYIYQLDSNWNRHPGNLNIGTLMVANDTGSGWQSWNIILDIVNNSDGAIRNLKGNLLFGLDYDGEFYWASIDTKIYTMVLDHSGNLTLSGYLYQYDAYDDLAIVKAITTKSITQNGKTKNVIDLSSLSLVNPDVDSQSRMSQMDLKNYYDVGKVQGFALCCLKSIALKLDEYDTNFDSLSTRVEALENQLKSNQTAA